MALLLHQTSALHPADHTMFACHHVNHHVLHPIPILIPHNHNDIPIPYNHNGIIMPHPVPTDQSTGTAMATNTPQMADGSSANLLSAKAALVGKGSTTFNADDHGYNGNINFDHPSDHGSTTFSGNTSGDFHGHDTFGGNVTYHDNSGFNIGGGVNVGPGGQTSSSISVGFSW